jgi:hypothetical protein
VWKWGDPANAEGADIAGATNPTYTPGDDDVGKFLKVTVTRTGYTGSVTSDATSAVLAASAPSPTVTGVTVTPPSTSVDKGGTVQFSAMVVGNNNPAQTVTWSIEGTHAAATGISADGLLSVDAAETAASLSVKAASTVDNSKSGTAAVTVTTPFVPVTGITMTSAATAAVGTPLALTGTVQPATATNRTIVWTVKTIGTTGATITGTTLNTTAAGTVTITAAIANGTAAGTDYTREFSITVGKQNQTGFAFSAGAPTSVTYGDDDFTYTTTGGSGDGAVTYAVTSGADVVSVVPGTGDVTI